MSMKLNYTKRGVSSLLNYKSNQIQNKSYLPHKIIHIHTKFCNKSSYRTVESLRFTDLFNFLPKDWILPVF